MSAFVIVAVCVVATFAYCVATTYVYLRLLWHFKQRGGYDPEFAAFFGAAFLPLGMSLLIVYSTTSVERSGLAPRAIRRERELKRQQEEIERLERELDLRL